MWGVALHHAMPALSQSHFCPFFKENFSFDEQKPQNKNSAQGGSVEIGEKFPRRDSPYSFILLFNLEQNLRNYATLSVEIAEEIPKRNVEI
jgi:hypothetical protein